MVDGKPGPPRIFVRRHILDIKEDTQEFLNEQINKVIAVRTAGRTIEAAGEVLKGAVSHPIGIAIVAGSLTALLIGIYGGGGPKENELIDKVKDQLDKGGIPVPDVFFEVWKTTYEVSRFMFPFLPVLPDVGTPPVPPPTEKELLCAQLQKELATAETNLQEEPGQADFWFNAIQEIRKKRNDAGC